MYTRILDPIAMREFVKGWLWSVVSDLYHVVSHSICFGGSDDENELYMVSSFGVFSLIEYAFLCLYAFSFGFAYAHDFCIDPYTRLICTDRKSVV